MSNNLLENKNALIFGAKGATGKAVSKILKEYGATIYMSDINVDGTVEESDLGSVRKLDTLNEKTVQEYFNWFDSEKVPVDIVINLSSSNPAEYNHGKPATEVSLEQFMKPLKSTTASQFITAKEAFLIMAKQQKGVIIFLTSTLSKVGSPWSPALTASHAATEGLVKSLAKEWGPNGVRVIGVMSEAMVDSPAIDYTFATMGSNVGLNLEEMTEHIKQNKTAMNKLPKTEDTAKVIALAASDLASYMTGTIINQSVGHVLE